MGEFDDFTRGLRSEHEVKDAEHKAEQERLRAARDADYNGQKALLEQVVLPLANEARNSCTAQGMRVEVVNNWQHGLIMPPVLEFHLFGPRKRPLDDSTYEIEANRAIFRVEDGKVRSAISTQAYASEIGKGFVGYDVDGIKQALKFSIMSYYDEIDPKRR